MDETPQPRISRGAGGGRCSEAVHRSIPFALYIAFLVIRPFVSGALPESVDPRWLYGVQVGAVLIALAVLWPRYAELRTPFPGVVDLGWGVAIGALVFAVWIHLDFPPFVVGSSAGFDPTTDGSLDVGLALVRIAGAVLIVPPMEELFWRSFILRWLQRPRFTAVDPRSVGWKAIALGSGVFALEHHLWLAGLIAGLAYAWLYVRSASLWVPILAHGVTNGLLGIRVLATGTWSLW